MDIWGAITSGINKAADGWINVRIMLKNIPKNLKYYFLRIILFLFLSCIELYNATLTGRGRGSMLSDMRHDVHHNHTQAPLQVLLSSSVRYLFPT